MLTVTRLPHPQRKLRVLGIDDAPFRRSDGHVCISGIVCAQTRFEGMIWGRTQRDGLDATRDIAAWVRASKYHPQLHAVLIDGIAVGGLAVIDLPRLASALQLPCIAVMRKAPDLDAMRAAMRHLPEFERRAEMLDKAGPISHRAPFYFQCAGIQADLAHEILTRTTDTGHVPEALRLAHLIGSAVIDGQSRGRA